MSWSRLPAQKLWRYGYGTACAMATVALLLLPISTPGGAEAPRDKIHAGARLTLKTTAPGGVALPLRFASDTTNRATAAAPSALPTLVGVAGDVVWLKSAVTGVVDRVPVGGELDGWRVVVVKPRSATLAREKERQTLELYRSTVPQGAGVSSPSALNPLVMPTASPEHPRPDVSPAKAPVGP